MRKYKRLLTGTAAALLSMSLTWNSFAASNVVVAGGGQQTQTSEPSPGQADAAAQSAPVVVSGPGAGSGPGVVGPGAVSGPGAVGPGVSGGPGAASQGMEHGTAGFAGVMDSHIVQVSEKYSYEQMTADIQKLSEAYPGLFQTQAIGTSLDGRTIFQLVLGNPQAEKHVLIQGGIHAREYMTPLLIMKQLEYGLAFYHTGSYDGEPLSQLLNQVAVHFVPMANPDGIAISQFGIGAIGSQQLRDAILQCYASDVALGRTQASFETYLTRWKANAAGVDLNQNFPANWEAIVQLPAPSYANYKGTAPLSEPESQALANLINTGTWAAVLNYHSMGNIIYLDYPGNQVQAQSRLLADAMARVTGYQLYDASGNGGFKDWLQIREQPVPSTTLEVGSVSCPMPVTEFPSVWNANQAVWALLARIAQTL